jgi:hypothetical protein
MAAHGAVKPATTAVVSGSGCSDGVGQGVSAAAPQPAHPHAHVPRAQAARVADPFAWFFEDPFFAAGAGGGSLIPRGGRDLMATAAPAMMKVDIKESETAFEIHADVPGARKVSGNGWRGPPSPRSHAPHAPYPFRRRRRT